MYFSYRCPACGNSFVANGDIDGDQCTVCSSGTIEKIDEVDPNENLGADDGYPPNNGDVDQRDHEPDEEPPTTDWHGDDITDYPDDYENEPFHDIEDGYIDAYMEDHLGGGSDGLDC